MKETTIKKNFRKAFDNKVNNNYFLLKDIIPKSAKKGTDVLKAVKFSQLKNKEIISVYEKCCNCKWLLTKKTIQIHEDTFKYNYEIYYIEAERIGVGELIGPVIYKML